MFSSQEGHLYIRGGLLNFIVSLRFKSGWLLYTYQSENKKKGGEKKEKKREGDVKGAGNGSDLYNPHYWHPLALKPSRQPPWLVLFYTIMILFLGGEGITFISTPYSLWLLSFRLQARGLLWVSIPTSHLKRGVRHWGLTLLDERGGLGGSFSKVAPFLTWLAWNECIVKH